jgi:superfamily II DNA or RNA helicase
MQINKHRLARQELGADRVIANFIKKLGATVEWATGVGKSMLAELVINRMLIRDNTRTTIIVVPTEQLKEQWELKIIKRKIPNTRVFVVNGITINDVKLECTLLVLDEFHRYASDVFSRVFNIKHQFLLCLTATVDRLDGKHNLLLEKAPIVDTITLQEAKRNGWVSDYLEYNLGLELTEEDRLNYNRINKKVNGLMAFFGHNFDTVKQCCNKHYASNYARDNDYNSEQVLINAVNCMRSIRERKSFLYGTIAKQDAIIEIIRKDPDLKTITFSESTDFADELTDNINNEFGEISLAYHSNLQTKIIEGKKFGPVKLKREVLKRFVDNRYKITIVNTAKALDEGSDFPDVVRGIIASSTSNPRQHTQRVGRILRDFINKYGDKKLALIINLYIKNTQDEKWLRKRQTDPKTKRPINPNVIEINSIDEIEYGTESLSLSATS